MLEHALYIFTVLFGCCLEVGSRAATSFMIILTAHINLHNSGTGVNQLTDAS
jgi:hypothetical protein